jgi:hypothetical protein
LFLAAVKGEGRRATGENGVKGEGRREKGEGRREKGEGRTAKKEEAEGRRENGEKARAEDQPTVALFAIRETNHVGNFFSVAHARRGICSGSRRERRLRSWSA